MRKLVAIFYNYTKYSLQFSLVTDFKFCVDNFTSRQLFSIFCMSNLENLFVLTKFVNMPIKKVDGDAWYFT